MKYIQKGGEPPELTDWKAKSNVNWKPTFENLSGSVKAAVKHALMKEQGFICCYCECRLENEDSHIEHFKPQRLAKFDSLDYWNMLCSCQSDLKRGAPRHCGHLKGDWFDEDLLISPLQSGCEARFAYLFNGEILAVHKDDKGADETIKQLGLGIPKLIALRQRAIEPFLDQQLSDDQFERFVNGYLRRDEQGMYPAFFTTISYLFSKGVNL